DHGEEGPPGRGPQEACRGCDHERANRFEDEVGFDPQASHTSIVAGAHRVARGSWWTTETMRSASGVRARWSSSTVKATTMIPMSPPTTTSWTKGSCESTLPVAVMRARGTATIQSRRDPTITARARPNAITAWLEGKDQSSRGGHSGLGISRWQGRGCRTSILRTSL